MTSDVAGAVCGLVAVSDVHSYDVAAASVFDYCLRGCYGYRATGDWSGCVAVAEDSAVGFVAAAVA